MGREISPALHRECSADARTGTARLPLRRAGEL